MKIDLLVFDGCPHVVAARALLHECLAEVGLERATVVERHGDHPSPSILVDGDDVMGVPAAEGRACRLDLPTRDKLLGALRRGLIRGGST